MANLDFTNRTMRGTSLYCYVGEVVPCLNSWQESVPGEPDKLQWHEERDFEVVVYVKPHAFYTSQPGRLLTPAFEKIGKTWERLREYPRVSDEASSAVSGTAPVPARIYYSRKQLPDEIRIVISSPNKEVTRDAAKQMLQDIHELLEADIRQTKVSHARR